MDNKKKYDQAFTRTLEVKEEQLAGLQYQGVPTWDSVGHMNLIGELEELFDIEMETDDVIAFSSYEKGIKILGKYNIEI